MCLIPNHHKRMYVWSQTISKRECVRNVCGTCFFCVWYVGKNRAYAYVYASLWQTRCVCMQIYIKSIANAHVLCALLTYHNKRACVWLENRKRLRFFSIAAHFLVFRAVLPSLPLVAGAMNVEQGMVATLRDAEMNEQVAATEAASGSEIQYASPTGEIKFVLPTCSTRAFAHSDTKGKKTTSLYTNFCLKTNKIMISRSFYINSKFGHSKNLYEI